MNRTKALKFAVLTILAIACLTGLAVAQTATGTLRGQVTDPTAAVIPQATVSVKTADGQTFTATTKGDGTYEVKNVPAGKCTVEAAAKGFSPAQIADVEVAAGQIKNVNVSLVIEVAKEVVQVEDQATKVEVDPSQNAGAIVIKGKDLDALSEDPDELQADLEALAGPSAGPNGGQIYIDGFSNGQLPPKSAIREVRINQNPFSPEFDHIGFGRIEIFTKPGQDKFRGMFMTNIGNSALNSLSPFLHGESPDYHSEQFSGNFSGPINKNASFFFNVERRALNDSQLIAATILDDNFNPIEYNKAVLNPQMRMSIGPRIDYQLTKSNTLTARYHLSRGTSSNNGVGGNFNLESLATSRESTGQELQLSDTQVISNYTVNETRFEYERNRSNSLPTNFAPTIGVGLAFTTGGSSSSVNHEDNIELQNATMQTRGKHFLKIGGRLRYDRQAAFSDGGFNGSFSFANIGAYQQVEQGLAQGLTMAQVRAGCIGQPKTTDPNQTNTLLDCAPSSYSVTFGQQNTLISQADVGVFFADDWRVRSNVTLSYGLRLESQNNIGDHLDFAPRLAVAWGIGRGKSTPKTVLRAGAGMFYDRFPMGTVLRAETLNGIFQQQYRVQYIYDPVNNVYTNPGAIDFYANLPSACRVPSPTYGSECVAALPTQAALQGNLQQATTYTIDPKLRTPYMVQAAVSLERQLTKTATVSVNYVRSRGLHQTSTFYTGTLFSQERPYEISDDGIFNQQQLMIIPNVRISSWISLNSFYTLGWAKGTQGSPSQPVAGPTGTILNQNLMADYGRSPFDVRHRFMVMGTISLPYGFRMNPNFMASSGRPFNITTGYDLNGDTFSNERPSYADPNNTDPAYTANVVRTPWGLLNRVPQSGEKIVPVNYFTGPSMVTVGLRLSKTFAIGRRKGETVAQGAGGPGGPTGMGGDHGPGGGGPHGGGDHGPGGPGGGGFRGGFGGGMRGGPGGGGASNGRYSLTISAEARNLLNHVNYGSPIADLSQDPKLLGTYNSIVGGGYGGPGGSTANRRFYFQAMFSF